ncbi:MAG: DUF748 domain-containing protein, partial [Myxococcota bacterium]
VEIADLVLEGPELALVRAADGFLELPALPPSTEPKPEEVPAVEPSEPMPVRLHAFTARDTELRLVDAGGGEDLLDFRLAELGLDDLALVGARVGLGGIRISEPRLSVRRELQDTRLGARGAPTADPTEEEAEAAPPELRIDLLDIERAEFSVVTDEEPVALALRLRTSDVSFAPESPFPLDLRVEVGDGSLGLVGQLGLNPPSWDGSVSWERLQVPLLVRAALPDLIPWIRSCAASGELDVKFTPAELRASGRAGVDSFAVEDPEQELAVGWKALAIELREMILPLGTSGEPMQLTLGAISLDAPSARYVLPNTAVERLLASAGGADEPPAEGSPEAAPAEASDAPAPEPRIRIEAIEVRGGEAEFVDRSEGAPYRGRVRDLSVDVGDVRLPERTVAKLRVRGLAPEGAPFDLEAALPGTSGNARLALERLPLAQFTPYAARAANLSIPAGELSLDTKAKLARSGAEGEVETQVRVHRLALEGATDAITIAGLPLDLLLALLRDPKGDIALPVPLRYGEAGAGTRLRTVLGGALTAALKGAATSPLKAAGALLPEGGGAAVAFDPIAFVPGSATVTSDARERLAATARLLAERPTLGLTLRGSAGPDDRDPLAERVLIDRVAGGQGLPELPDAPFFARRRVQGALAARGRGEPGALEAEDAVLLARYVAAVEVPGERFTGLAQGRADALRSLLEGEHGVGAARVVAEAASARGPAEVTLALRLGPAAAPAAGVR